MTNTTSKRGTCFPTGRRLLLVLCVTALGVSGTIERGVPAAFAAAAPTTLTVAAASGSYGGTATVSATLTSGAVDIAGESVDFHLGATELGPAVTGDDGIASISGVSLAAFGAGTFTGEVTAGFAGDVNFAPASGSADLTVTPAPLTITADNQTKVYGAALPALTASYTGFVNGDTAGNLTTQPTLTTAANASSHVAGSPYSISVSGAVDPNYSITYVSGALTITAAPLTITADDQTTAYGNALPTLTANYSGFVNGDTTASLTTQPTLATTATAASSVAGSPYAITASGAADSDYTISYVDGSLSVTTAPLTITADDQTKVYGDALPTLTASYSGFQNGETLATSDVTGSPSLSTTATATSPVFGSPYPITAAQDSLSSGNYSFTFVTGNLTITPAPLTITADDQTKAYGAAVPALTASFTGFVNGDTSASLATQPTCTTTATLASLPGAYPITCSGAADGDYDINYVAGSLTIPSPPVTNPPATITKITPVLSWATPAAITFGTALGTGQLNATTAVPGTFTYSSPAGSVLAVGTYLMTVLFTPFDTVDYNDASALVYLTVMAAPPVVAAPASTPVPPTVTVPLAPATSRPAVVSSVATSLPTPIATQPAAVGLVIHNNARTEVGGRTKACDLAGNTKGAKERGCEIVSSVSTPGAAVTYTLTYADSSTQHFTDTADRRGHSLHVFNVAYRPAAAAGRGTGRTVATILVQATLANGAVLVPVHVRFAVMR